jgi:hypothetical protein
MDSRNSGVQVGIECKSRSCEITYLLIACQFRILGRDGDFTRCPGVRVTKLLDGLLLKFMGLLPSDI